MAFAGMNRAPRAVLLFAAVMVCFTTFGLQKVDAGGGKKFTTKIVGVERDSGKRLLGLTVTVETGNPQIDAWRSWLVKASGAAVTLSQTERGADAADAGHLSPGSGDEAVVQLDAPDGLSFAAVVGDTVIVWQK